MKTLRSFPNSKKALNPLAAGFTLPSYVNLKTYVHSCFRASCKTLPSASFLAALTRVPKYRRLLIDKSGLGVTWTRFLRTYELHSNPAIKAFLQKKNTYKPAVGSTHGLVQLNELNVRYRSTSYLNVGHYWRPKLVVLPMHVRDSRFLHIDLSASSNLHTSSLKRISTLDTLNFEFLNFFVNSVLFSRSNASLGCSLAYYRQTLFNLSEFTRFEARVTRTATKSLNVFQNTFTQQTTPPTSALWVGRRDKKASLVERKKSIYNYLLSSTTSSLTTCAYSLYSYARIPKGTFRSRTSVNLNWLFYAAQSFGVRSAYRHRRLNSSFKIKRLNIFTHVITLENYLRSFLTMSRKTDTHLLWNGTRLSRTFTSVGGLVGSPYLINSNENAWENSIYLKPKTGRAASFEPNHYNLALLKVLIVTPKTRDCSTENPTTRLSALTSLKKVNWSRAKQPTDVRFRNVKSFKGLPTSLPNKITLRDYLQNKLLLGRKLYFTKALAVAIKKITLTKNLYKSSGKFIRAFSHTSFSRKNVIVALLKKTKPVTYLKFKYAKKLASLKYKTKRQDLLKALAPTKKSTSLLVFRKKKFKVLKRLRKLRFKKKLLKKYFRRTRIGRWVQNHGALAPTLTSYKLKRRKFSYSRLRISRQRYWSNQSRTQRKVRTLAVKVCRILNTEVDGDQEPSVARSQWALLMNVLGRNITSAATYERTSAQLLARVDCVNTAVSAATSYVNEKYETLISHLFFLNAMLKNPLVFKYALFRKAGRLLLTSGYLPLPTLEAVLGSLERFCFGSRWDLIKNSNVYPLPTFNYQIRRRLVSLLTFRKFSTHTSIWYFNMLVRFAEFCTGRKVYIKLNPFIEKSLLLTDQMQCRLWESRVAGFQRILGPKLFVKESLRIFMIALKYKDPTFLINWIKAMLYRMSFWKYRVLFRYIKFVLKNLFEPNFEVFGLRGFKVKLKGKVSVAGNARTRTLLFRVGRTSHSEFSNKIAHSFTLINSFTGVMGFNLWFFF